MQPMLSAQTRKGGAGSLEEYTDLYQLLSKDYEANQYYSLLPYDVKQALGYKADHILSLTTCMNSPCTAKKRNDKGGEIWQTA